VSDTIDCVPRGDFVAAAGAFGFTADGVEPALQIAVAARATGRNVKTCLLEEQRSRR